MENVGYISQIYIVRRCQLCSAAKVKYGSSCMFVIMVAKKTLDISYIFAYDFYIFGLWFLSSSVFSLPNLSGRRLDVYHTSTHGVALMRI